MMVGWVLFAIYIPVLVLWRAKPGWRPGLLVMMAAFAIACAGCAGWVLAAGAPLRSVPLAVSAVSCGFLTVSWWDQLCPRAATGV
jgi:hypothetical protein